MKYLLLPCTLLCLCLTLNAQTIPTPTQTDAIIIDNGAAGKADPNDRIRYNVTIQNTGGAPATGVQLNTVVDPRTTLVPGSFRSSPVGVNDAYTCTGNVGIIVPAASGVKVNDYDDNLALTTLAVTTAPVNGTVTLNNDGSFTYSPNAGFAGVETFVYTITDGNSVGVPAPLTDVATVSITVSNVIWFVDNSVAGPGTGTVIDPFKILTGAATASSAGHVIFVKNTGATYWTGIALKNTQSLFGTGHSGGTNLADPGVLPFTMAPNSKPLPAIGGARPLINNGNGNGITLASGNTIRGVDVGRCVNGAKIFGSSFGTLTVGNTTSPDVALSGNHKILSLTNGTFAATSKFVSIATGDSSTTQAISLNTVGGTLASGSTTIIQGIGTTGIDIQNSTASLDFGTTSINHFTSGAAISITNSGTGSVSFSSLAVNSSITGLFASTGGTINIGGTTNTLVTSSGPALDLTSTSLGAGATFSTLSSTSNISGKGVNLDNVTGPLVANGGSIVVSGAGNIGFDINAGTGAVTYGGSMTYSAANRVVEITGRTGSTVTFSGNITATAGTGINVASNTGGTITFSGATKSLSTAANTAVTLATNTGSTINFTGGGLVISTTTGAGFNATGGGTVSVTGTNNTINSVSNTALNVSSTTIGAGNLNFLSISAGNNTAAADPATGILLFTTGAAGSLIVTGSGSTNASGGTIQNITNRGVDATTTINLALSNMTFTNANLVDGSLCNATNNASCNAAIHLNTVTGVVLNNIDINGTAEEGINVLNTSNFSLTGSDLINCGTASSGADTEESCLYAINMSGTCSISSSSLTLPSERAAVIYNTSKTMTLTVDGSTFGMNQSSTLGADGLEVDSYGASNTTIDVTNCTFVQPKTNGLQVISEGTSTTNVNVTGSTFDPGPGSVGAAAIDFVTNTTGVMNFNIIGNGSIASRSINTVNISGNGNSTFQGRINNNTIQIATGGSGSGIGVRVIANADSDGKVEVNGNTISGIVNDVGILAQAVAGTGRLDAKITSNNISAANTAGYYIDVIAGASSSILTNKVCANVANNITAAPSNLIQNWRARAATPSHELLLQGAGPTASANWNNNGNSPAAPPALINQSGTGVFTFGQTCLLPTNPLP